MSSTYPTSRSNIGENRKHAQRANPCAYVFRPKIRSLVVLSRTGTMVGNSIFVVHCAKTHRNTQIMKTLNTASVEAVHKSDKSEDISDVIFTGPRERTEEERVNAHMKRLKVTDAAAMQE